MAADKNNPIRYSDLISPDNSIVDLIAQLEKLNETYSATLSSVKKEAIQLAQALGNVSGATEEGRQKTKQAATEAERLAKAEKDVAFAQSETAKKLAQLNQAKNEQNRINKLIVKLNNAQEGSYDRLSAQYSLNKIRINAMTKAEREAAEASEGLISKTKDLYEQMKNFQEETGKFQLNVGNYENSIKSALGLSGEFGESLLAMGRGGEDAKSAFSAMSDGAKALGKTLLGLMSNPVFLAVAGITAAGAGFKFWYDYNAGLVEATRLTKQFTNKSGADLKNYRNSVQAVADAYGEDFREMLIASNALAKQFGISADEALKLIQDGFIAGANANGEFVDSVKEYPAYLKEAGISAEGFVAIISQTATAGIFSDKGVDAIKEANLRLREMTPATAAALEGLGISSEKVQEALRSGAKTTFDIMQEVSAKLAEFPEASSEVGTAIADIFGGPGEDAGLQYLKTLKDISLNMDEVKGKAGELGRLQEEQLESQKELTNTLSALFDITGGTFERLQTNVKIFINTGLTRLIKGVINLANYIIDLYNNSLPIRFLWNTIATNAKNAIDVIGNAFKAVGDLVVSIGKIIKGAFTFDWDEYKKGVKNYLMAVPNFVKNSAMDIKENMSQAVEDINGKIEPIKIPLKVVPEGETDKPTGVKGGGVDYKKKIEETIARKKFEQKELSGFGFAPDELKVDGISLEFGQEEIEQIQNFVDSFNKEIEKQQPKDIYDIFGFNLSDEKKDAINTSMSYALDALNTFMQAKIAAANAAVQASEREIDKAQRALEIEKTAAANGYASNVAYAQKNLDLARKNQEKAIKDQQKAQRQQQAIQAIQQIGNMVLASSLIWSQLGFPWAIPAIAVMWASFAASKIKAAQMAKSSPGSEAYGEGTVELLEGGSHQSGRDIDLGTKPDGTKRRAEGGEFFAVINKRNSRKYRNIIPSVINSLNDGTFANKYLHAYDGANGLNVTIKGNDNPDLRGLSDDVREIRDINRRRMFTDGQGNTVVEYKNLRRTYKSL